MSSPTTIETPPTPDAAGDLSSRSPRASAAIAFFFGLGGVPALIDQVAWERILALHSGVGAFSIAMIVTAYMAGLGVGAQVGGRASRHMSPRAALWSFSAMELALGIFAWFSASFYYELPGLDRSWFHGTTWRVGLAHFLVLLPPTVLMGMTLPLLVRALARDVSGAPRLIAELYGVNVLGAAAGALLTPWILIPEFGIEGALRFGACCNVLGALGVLVLGTLRFGVAGDTEPPEPSRDEGVEVSSAPRRSLALWAALYTISGFHAIALEVVWFRLIDVGVKGTAFTFGSVLAVYLGGLAVGSLLGARWKGPGRDPLVAFLAFQCGILAYTGLVMLALVRIGASTPLVGWYVEYWASYEPIAPQWSTLKATLGLYAVFPAVLFGAPTVLMGLSFAALQRGVQHEARSSGYRVGILQSANIAGCVAGGLVVGLWAFDRVGTAETLRWIVGTGCLLALLAAWEGMRQRGVALLGVGLAVGLLVIASSMPTQDTLWIRLHGGREGPSLITEGRGRVTALTPDMGDRWRMSVNGKGQSHLPFGGIHTKLGALPATLHPNPRSVAIIGLGSGDTAWAAGCSNSIAALEVFEVCASQHALLKQLDARVSLPALRAFLGDTRFQVEEADGRAALARDEERYDILETDAIRPNGASSGNLYSVEFFTLCARRLEPGGLMCTWAPTPRTRASFHRVFPHVLSLDNGVILIGSNDPITLDRARWEARLRTTEVATYLGGEALQECLASIATARITTGESSPLTEVNTDLAPYDEYERPLR